MRLIFFRGDDFRIAYAHLGEIRSLLQDGVNVMALTVTATRKTYAVCLRLSMTKPLVVGCSSYRDNIKYYVQPQPDMGMFCCNMATELKELGPAYPKTIIFCRQYKDC